MTQTTHTGLPLSVVAPCYNEEAVLPQFVGRMVEACRGCGVSFEIVLVNDGSRDTTWNQFLSLAKQFPEVVCVNLARNHGQQLALTAGLHVCRGDRILIIDADLQDQPELLADMMRIMDGGADVVYGQRRNRKGETLAKRFSSAMFYRLMERLTDVPIPRDTGDFRLMSRRVLDVLLTMPERHRFVRGMVSWVGFQQVPLAYDRDARFAGVTNYRFWKLLRLTFDAITSFTIKPLTWASKIGFVSSVISLGLLVYTLTSWALGHSVTGWTSLMAVLALLGSVQLFFIGVLGEYVGRMYDQTKGRPLFIIESIHRSAEPASGVQFHDTELKSGVFRPQMPQPVVHIHTRPVEVGSVRSDLTESPSVSRERM
jgi:dolichol-phosphate mannosyltransferase